MENISFNLRSSLENIIDLLTQRAKEKNLKLAFHIPPKTPDALIGDPGRLRQIIVNLVDTAIKFTDHGEIKVRSRIEAQTKNDISLHFSVRATNHSDKQKHFSQLYNNLTNKDGSVGMGLTLCSELVEMLHGLVAIAQAKPSLGQIEMHAYASLGSRELTEELSVMQDRYLPLPPTDADVAQRPVSIVCQFVIGKGRGGSPQHAFRNVHVE